MRHFTAAIMGYGGMFTTLKRWKASRYSLIRAIVLVAGKSEKLELTVSHSAADGEDYVKLTRRNWQTGAESELYNGKLTGGKPKHKRQLHD